MRVVDFNTENCTSDRLGIASNSEISLRKEKLTELYKRIFDFSNKYIHLDKDIYSSIYYKVDKTFLCLLLTYYTCIGMFTWFNAFIRKSLVM